jgi:hypothetical protein
MPLLWMAMTAMLWQADSTPTPAHLNIMHNEIWLQTGSVQRQLTHDGVPKRLPTLSPSGDAVIYVVDHPVPQNPPKETIVLLGIDGKVRQTFIPQGYVPAPFDRVEWIDEHRIGAMSCGRANCMYWVLSADSGKTIAMTSGGFDFIWSHNRQFVARRLAANRGDSPEGVPQPEHDAVALNNDDVTVYPPEMLGKNFDDSHSHEIGLGKDPTFVWSPDDKWVAFTDVIGPDDDWYVVLVSPQGRMLRDTVPIGADYDATLEWVDSTHMDLHAGKRVFHFAIRDQKFSEIADDH